jgi:hypothetical protein
MKTFLPLLLLSFSGELWAQSGELWFNGGASILLNRDRFSVLRWKTERRSAW